MIWLLDCCLRCPDFLLTTHGEVKLADFGLARVLDLKEPRKPLSHQVATRWYRAPELLFASRQYDFSVDIWSVAVVFAELIALKPLFPGNNDIDQMYRVFQVMGSPSPTTWPVCSSSSASLLLLDKSDV